MQSIMIQGEKAKKYTDAHDRGNKLQEELDLRITALRAEYDKKFNVISNEVVGYIEDDVRGTPLSGVDVNTIQIDIKYLDHGVAFLFSNSQLPPVPSMSNGPSELEELIREAMSN